MEDIRNKCIICGEAVNGFGMICDDCKEAIEWAKRCKKTSNGAPGESNKGLEALNKIKELNSVGLTAESSLSEAVEKELKAYSSLKKIIKDKIKKINNRIDKMNKMKEENEHAFANADFKEEYNFHKAQVLAFYFVLQKMEKLEKEVF